jgi:hypothetical protein
MKHRHSFTGETGSCVLCGANEIEPMEDTYMLLRGQFMESTDLQRVIFVLDPDTALDLVKLPNGNLALIAPEGPTTPTKYVEVNCMHALATDVGGAPIDPDTEQKAIEDLHGH